LESVSEVLGENWLDGSLELLGDWVFVKACTACCQIMPDMDLGDIPKLLFAVSPCPLLTKVAILIMPLIHGLEDFLSRKDLFLSSLFNTVRGSESPGAQITSTVY
jgi:hypothetical protein